MHRVIVIDERDVVAEAIIAALGECAQVELCRRGPPAARGAEGPDGLTAIIEAQRIDTVIFAPAPTPGKRAISFLGPHASLRASLNRRGDEFSWESPDLDHAEAIFHCCARSGIKRLILLASTAAWEPTHCNPGLISESRPLRISRGNRVVVAWIELERLARACLGSSVVELTLLRLAPMPIKEGRDYFSRLFARRIAVSFAGYDPSIQFLSLADLCAAVRCAIQNSHGGIFNVAPDTVIPLSDALLVAGATRIQVPSGLQRLARAALAPAGLTHSIDQAQYLRYSFTVSNQKIKRDLGFTPARSSVQTLMDVTAGSSRRPPAAKIPSHNYDPFGMDKDYIAAYGRTLFKFLERYYWRIELDGIERVPQNGRAMIVGVHRGFMPWDGVMALHLMVQRIGRYPRFLVHPGLVKFPFLFNFIRRLGGVIACRKNADYLLERDEMIGMFPEGVQGAFSLYRDAYRLGKFGRDEFVKMAVRNRTPIVPFVTVGSAEVFPILKKFEWSWWKRRTEWPCFPITPTFPLLPLPLPSKWHTQFLPPIHIEDQYGTEAANNPRIVQTISQKVRDQLQAAMNGMLARRKSVFYGSLFEDSSR